MTYFVNVTPHAIRLAVSDGDRPRVIQPSGSIARVNDRRRVVCHVDEIPVNYLKETQIRGLPKPREGVIYIASSLVARFAAAEGRTDVIAPDTSRFGAIRDGQGRIMGVRGFLTFVPEVAA